MSKGNEKVQLLGRRIVAYSIDMFLASFLCIGMILLLIPLSMYISKDELLLITGKIDTTVTYYSFVFIYFLVQEMFWHKTVGKKLLKLEIVHSDGKKLQMYQLILRNVFRIVDVVTMVGLLITPFNSKNQRLGDILSKTVVVAKRVLLQKKEEK